MRNILSMNEAERILSPYFEQITDCVKRGFTDYVDMIGHDCYSKNRVLGINPKIRGGFINNLISIRIAESFKETKAVTAKEYNGVFGLHFRNQLLLRFKKFNARLAPSRSRTKQTVRIENQQTVIPGFPRKPTFLYVGYTFNKNLTGIESIYLSLRVKGRREWLMDISRHINSDQNVIPFTSAQQKPTKRVRVKQSAQKVRKAS